MSEPQTYLSIAEILFRIALALEKIVENEGKHHPKRDKEVDTLWCWCGRPFESEWHWK
jgi:hypothetical protein